MSSHSSLSDAAKTGEKKSYENTPAPDAKPDGSQVQNEKVIEETPVEEAAALDKLSDEPEYPSGAK